MRTRAKILLGKKKLDAFPKKMNFQFHQIYLLLNHQEKKKYYNLTNINQRIPRLNRLLEKSNTDINLYNKHKNPSKKASINQNINRFGSAT